MARTGNGLRFFTLSAILAALLSLLSPITLPIGPIPITLSLFALFLVASAAPPTVALTATAVYLALGAVGLPVFSGYEGGFQKFVGPTGGFLWAYLPAAALLSAFLTKWGDRKWAFPVGMVPSLLLVYLGGILWYALSVPASFGEALAVTVLPFLLPDALKIAAASAVGYVVRKRFPLSVKKR